MPNARELWEKFQADIKPTKGNTGNQKATRKFIGRTDHRQAYYQMVSGAIREKFSQYYVLNFHGSGGLGKTALLNQLEKELLAETGPMDEASAAWQDADEEIKTIDKKKKIITLRADLDNATLTTPDAVLRHFRAQFMEQTDVIFPLFDVAMYDLAKKEGQQLPPDKEKELRLNNPVLSFMLDVAADLTGTGLLLGATRTLAEAFKDLPKKIAAELRNLDAALEEIHNMDSAELRRRLPLYFAMDVNAKGLPLILVYLDTYEKGYSDGEGIGYKSGFDLSWLSGPDGLITNLGNAVFAIAGRDKLNLDEQVQAQSRYLDALSEKDTKDYFKDCGMEETLSGELYRLTQGNPVFMDLCVDEHKQILRQGKTPAIEDFSRDRKQLVERHTRYVPVSLHQALYLLATLERWTQSLYDALCVAFPKDLPAKGSQEYQLLMNLSYIQEDGDGYYMQRLVADVLIQKFGTEYRKKLGQALWDYAQEENLPLAERQKAVEPMLRLEPRDTILAMKMRGELYAEQYDPAQARRWYELAIHSWRICLEKQPDTENITRIEEEDLLDGWLWLPFRESETETWVLNHLTRRAKEASPQKAADSNDFPPALWRLLVAYGRWPEKSRPAPEVDIPSPETYQWTGEEDEGTLDAIWGWMQLDASFEQRLTFCKNLYTGYARCLGADHFKALQAEFQYVHYALNAAYRPDTDWLLEEVAGPPRIERVPTGSCLEHAEEIIGACKDLVEKHRRIRTADPRQIADACRNLAKAYSYDGQHREAADAERKAYSIYSKVYQNKPNKELFTCMHDLVRYSVHAGDLFGAGQILESLMGMAQDHPYYQAYLDTGIQLYQLRFERAMELEDEQTARDDLTRLIQLLELHEQKYGTPLYFETAGGRAFAACLEEAQMDWEEAELFVCIMARIFVGKTETLLDLCRALVEYENASDWRGLLSNFCLGVYYREDPDARDLDASERYLAAALALAEDLSLPFPTPALVKQELGRTRAALS